MNKRGEFMELMWDNLIYLVVLLVFVAGAIAFIKQQENGAAVWEDVSSKEITKVINMAKPGDSYKMDIQKISEIAYKNEVRDLENIVLIKNNQVCVRLSLGKGSCYSFMNNVLVVNSKIEQGVPSNFLSFDVVEFSGGNNE